MLRRPPVEDEDIEKCRHVVELLAIRLKCDAEVAQSSKALRTETRRMIDYEKAQINKLKRVVERANENLDQAEKKFAIPIVGTVEEGLEKKIRTSLFNLSLSIVKVRVHLEMVNEEPKSEVASLYGVGEMRGGYVRLLNGLNKTIELLKECIDRSMSVQGRAVSWERLMETTTTLHTIMTRLCARLYCLKFLHDHSD